MFRYEILGGRACLHLLGVGPGALEATDVKYVEVLVGKPRLSDTCRVRSKAAGKECFFGNVLEHSVGFSNILEDSRGSDVPASARSWSRCV